MEELLSGTVLRRFSLGLVLYEAFSRLCFNQIAFNPSPDTEIKFLNLLFSCGLLFYLGKKEKRIKKLNPQLRSNFPIKMNV